MTYLIKYFIYSGIDLLIFLLPLMGLHFAIVAYVGESDWLNALAAMLTICWLLLLGRIVQYQIDPQIGFIGGFRLGFGELKVYFEMLYKR